MANRVRALLDELAGVLAEMGALNEKEEAPNDEEMKSLEELEAKAEGLRSKIEFVERMEKREAELQAVIERAAPAAVIEKKEETAVAETRHFAVPKAERPLRAFQSEEDAYRSGMWLRAYLLNDQESRQWCRDHGVEARAQQGRVDGVDPNSPSLGGATVPDEMSRTIIRNVLEYGVFPKYAKTVTMNSDVLIQPVRTKGLEVTAVGENTAAPEKNVEVANFKLIAGHWAVMNRIPNSLLEDSVINFADLVADEIALAFAEKYDTLGFNGGGTAGEHNITGVCTKIIDGNHGASIAKAAGTHDTLAELDIHDFTAAMAKLPAYARRGAAWYMSPAAFGLAVTPIAMMAGGNTRSDIAGGPNESTFLGFPVRLVHGMESDAGAGTDKVFALFGDLSMAATFGQRRAVQIKTSTERYIEMDQTAMIAFSRMGIVVHDLGSNSVAGPLIAITGGAAT